MRAGCAQAHVCVAHNKDVLLQLQYDCVAENLTTADKFLVKTPGKMFIGLWGVPDKLNLNVHEQACSERTNTPRQTEIVCMA